MCNYFLLKELAYYKKYCSVLEFWWLIITLFCVLYVRFMMHVLLF